jgi:hypothetical protein
MSNDDEIERLLAEIDGAGAGSAPGPKRGELEKQPTAGAPTERGRVGGALRTGVVSGAVCGVGVTVATFLISWLPFYQSPINAGAGAFVGAFLTGTVLSLRGRA